MKLDRWRIHRAHAESAGAPAWTVTYADFVTLLLCLFVAILSMSTIKKDRFQTALGSLQQTFGTVATVPRADVPDLSIYGRLHSTIGQQASLDPKVEPADSWLSVTRIPQGARLMLGGPRVFERGRAELAGDARQRVAQAVRGLEGRSYTIIVRGHSAGETPDGEQNMRDLSYARAAAAALIFEQGGVSAETIRVVALGDGHPLLDHAYTEKRRAMNRRVEIEIIESEEPDEVMHLSPDEKG